MPATPQVESQKKVDSREISSREEWWALFDELRLSQQPYYAEYGGPVEFIRREREADSAGQ